MPESERIGFLFQKGVLIDSLNLAENVALALRAADLPYPQSAIDEALAAVGLSGAMDGPKMPGELSGGMLRRAALAQILAQRKRLVILDEPFVGCDPPVAAEIAQLLRRLCDSHGVAMVLISHMHDLAAALQPKHAIELERARPEDADAAGRETALSRLPFGARLGRRLADYLFYSLPLIICAFAATGAAVSMLMCDMLLRVDVVAIVSGFLQKYLQGNPALPMILSLVDRIVKANEAEAKKQLYALAISSVFVIELGPLLTALLLAGRIGGSYAGEVSMMAATNQLELLRVLGVPAGRWTFAPAIIAALIAAPLLTAVGTWVALVIGAFVGGPSGFDLITSDDYWAEVRTAILEHRPGSHPLKWAPLVNAYRSVGFMASTILIAQICARWRRRAQPRHVPIIITTAVVVSCLCVLLLDWGFSQLYVRLDDTHLVGAAAAAPAALYADRAEGGAAAGMHAAEALDDLAAADQAEYVSYYAEQAGQAPSATTAAAAEEDLDVDVDGDHDEL